MGKKEEDQVPVCSIFETRNDEKFGNCWFCQRGFLPRFRASEFAKRTDRGSVVLTADPYVLTSLENPGVMRRAEKFLVWRSVWVLCDYGMRAFGRSYTYRELCK